MTSIKLCGLSRPCDIEAANALMPEYIGFVFAPGSRRYIAPERACQLRRQLARGIRAVGVFVNAPVEHVADILNRGIADMAQLHGDEDEDYMRALRGLTDGRLIQAIRVHSAADVQRAQASSADEVLLDSGAGTGRAFDWALCQRVERPYFLAGGLSPDNVAQAIRQLHPMAVDVSSGVETNGFKDMDKMAAFVAAVRKEGRT